MGNSPWRHRHYQPLASPGTTNPTTTPRGPPFHHPSQRPTRRRPIRRHPVRRNPAGPESSSWSACATSPASAAPEWSPRAPSGRTGRRPCGGPGLIRRPCSGRRASRRSWPSTDTTGPPGSDTSSRATTVRGPTGLGRPASLRPPPTAHHSRSRESPDETPKWPAARPLSGAHHFGVHSHRDGRHRGGDHLAARGPSRPGRGLAAPGGSPIGR
jgi:hypothetical protein